MRLVRSGRRVGSDVISGEPESGAYVAAEVYGAPAPSRRRTLPRRLLLTRHAADAGHCGRPSVVLAAWAAPWA